MTTDPDRARIRREALEEAAKIVERRQAVARKIFDGSSDDAHRLFEKCIATELATIAAAIRALADEAGAEEPPRLDPQKVAADLGLVMWPGENIFDCVMRVRSCSFPAAVNWLHDRTKRPLPPPPKADKDGRG